MNTAPMINCAGCKHSYAVTALFCPNCGTPKARDAAPVDPLLGKVLGERFQIHELIGHGGSGTIYRAEHVTLRRKVAIKVLHNELSRDDLAIERFRREATTVAEIDNEHIVEIHDFGRTADGRLYLAMELLEGETLDYVLAREQQLSVERTADVLIQVGEALMEAHAIGYVHRDLRPRNIYLAVRRGKANFIKLLDFGLAKLVESDAQAASTSLGMTFGDPRYMSPEQARGDRIDRRADIYQLGCVAYEMLTGAPPFTGNRVFDILSKQVTEIPTPLPTRRPGVPLWMEAAVAKMLAKDPENRFATTTRMVEALRRGLETGEVMEDEIARRRESIPPPSVSRVMQKMGLGAPIDPPAPQPLTGKETLKGHLEGPLARSAEEPRRRTGTPQVGVPIMSQPAVAGQIEPKVEPRPVEPHPLHTAPATVHTAVGVPALAPSVQLAPHVAAVAHEAPSPAPIPAPVPPAGSGPASSAPVQVDLAGRVVAEAPRAPVMAASAPDDASRAPHSSARLGIGDSAAWFDDGERASAEADNVRRRKLISPSTTDLSLYDEPLPRRRWPMLVGVITVLGLVGGTIAFAVSRGDDREPVPQADPIVEAPPPAVPADVPPSQIISPEGSATPPAPAAVTAPPETPEKPKNKDTGKATAKVRSGATSAPSGAGRKSSSTDSSAARRPSGGGWFDEPAHTDTPPPVTPAHKPPVTPPPPPPGVSGTEGPVDPYGGSTDAPPTESPEKKADFFANLGKQQLSSGDTAGAAASFKKALELDPKNVPAVIGMGEIALRQGLFGDAMAHLKKAARLAPRSSHVFTLLGEAYLGTGNDVAAAEQFKKALQLDPDNVRARDGFNEAQSRVPPAEDD